jgi:putative addiction module CopG family antidote
MSLQLAPEHETIIHTMLATGRYGSPEEALGAALQLLEEDELVHEYRRERLKRDIELGMADAATGRVTQFDPDGLKRKVRERLESLSNE